MGFIEELYGDVIDWSFVDTGETIGRGTEPVTVDIVSSSGVLATPAGSQPL